MLNAGVHQCCRGVRVQCVYLESCTSLTWTELIMSCKDCIVMVAYECRQKHKAANSSVSWQSHFCGSHMPQKYFKWFISSELSVLLSWSINMQRQDGNQQCPSLTSEGRGLFLLISAEERPCYSENSHPRHQLTGPLFLVFCLDKVICFSVFFCFLSINSVCISCFPSTSY